MVVVVGVRAVFFFFFFLTIWEGISAQLCSGGTCHVTTHSFKDPIDQHQITYADEEVKEWHFHVYFFQDNNVSVEAALDLRDQLLQRVQNRYFVAVFDGVTDAILPGVNVSNIPPINYGPRGPHPCGSYEVWVPIEYVGRVLSFFMLSHGELTILLHPLTSHELEDHVGRLLWLGPPYRIDVTVLEPYDIDTPEYPELELGYHAPLKSQQNTDCANGDVSQYAPCKWANFLQF
eukprot:CAMPEP_0201489860 /NCGR_PEP_ID=MMETSP0151_2-20130828/23976_1 /ASSEMBLY_ACC=CAM_ASM_000257 /TAXON_ID=200890 /ORGANISM="Paramoeba atlantica, Strain 621/1 / CCAP 1560/9" /LENGTH=232 /DNA_ID=CAMNT_0047875579 /DNA_START=18 /DNA_END=716 /DNA_ORIENTATION=+